MDRVPRFVSCLTGNVPRLASWRCGVTRCFVVLCTVSALIVRVIGIRSFHDIHWQADAFRSQEVYD